MKQLPNYLRVQVHLFWDIGIYRMLQLINSKRYQYMDKVLEETTILANLNNYQ